MDGWSSVESRTGAVAVAYRWVVGDTFAPPPQSARAWIRFLSPLVKPDVRTSGIRLSPNLSGLRSRQVGTSHWHAVEAECPIEDLVRDLAEPGPSRSRPAHHPARDPPLGVVPASVIDVHARPLIEVPTPAAKHAADADDHAL